jgi:hypothetical protein
MLLQGLDPKMAVEQQKLAAFVTISSNDGRLYDANLTD